MIANGGIVLMFLGGFVLLLASVGVLLLPDALSRQHAATKSGSLGVVLIVTGVGFVGGEFGWFARATLIAMIVWLTMPVASHILARAALLLALRKRYRNGGAIQSAQQDTYRRGAKVRYP